jgi:erythromycin esterase-like protein
MAGRIDTGVEPLRRAMRPIRTDGDYDALIAAIGDARFVLLGEASHGTHEFYSHRAAITRRLITEQNFNVVAVEADWPDAYRVNRFVRALSDDRDAGEALRDFKRFPNWMWRNGDVLEFVDWLRRHNDGLKRNDEKTGFYGVDLYSLFTSIEAVLDYLEKVDPKAAAVARERYSCFDHFGDDSQAYGYATSSGMQPSCEEEVIEQLVALRRNAAEYASRDGSIPPDELFFAEQNARLVTNAERYYRSMFGGRVSSWNLRDRHMADTIDALDAHFSRGGRTAKIVVWAHNSHLGDARATEMSRRGELNVGQLARERHGSDAFLIGFSTWSGTVTAADNWDEPPQRKRVRPASSGSYEELLHQVSPTDYYLLLREAEVAHSLRDERLQRAIGVIYRPGTERMSHYFHARLPEQFDAILHFDTTRAVEPLEPTEQWHTGEAPETYPTGM